MPLAIEFSKVKKCLKTSKKLNRKIIGFDLNKKRIEELISGIDNTEEIDEESKKELKSITFINDKNADINADIFIISVPTPIDHENNPDLSFLKNATELAANFIIKEIKALHQYL